MIYNNSAIKDHVRILRDSELIQSVAELPMGLSGSHLHSSNPAMYIASQRDI